MPSAASNLDRLNAAREAFFAAGRAVDAAIETIYAEESPYQVGDKAKDEDGVEFTVVRVFFNLGPPWKWSVSGNTYEDGRVKQVHYFEIPYP